jgi:peptidyl-prolyl cis-trans isomerase C
VKRLLVTAVAAIAISATATACGTGIGGGYAAKVNGSVLKLSDLNEELRQIRDNKPYQDAIKQSGTEVLGKGGKNTFNSAFVAQVVNQDVLYTLVHQELQHRGLAVTDADVSQARTQVDQSFTDQQGQSILKNFSKWYQDRLVTRQAEVAVLETKVGNTNTDDAAVQQYYDQHKDQFAETCLRAIVTTTKDAAVAAKARVANGEDFGKVADSVNGQGTTNPGGDLGCDTSQLPAEVSQLAASLPINGVSDPIAAGSGVALLQVTKRDTKPLDDALKAQIRQTLQQSGNQQLTTVVFGLLDKSKIVVNPTIGTFKKGDPAKGEASSVVPNGAPTTSTSTPTGQTPTGQTPTGQTPTGQTPESPTTSTP